MKVCKAHNVKGIDKRGCLRKVLSYSGEHISPREAAAECLRNMQAGRSRSTQISVWEGECEGSSFVTSIGFGADGSRNWRVPATPEGVASLPAE